MSYAANDERPLRARVRRGLRRAVLVHPVQRRRRPTPSPARMPTRVRALEERHRLRDHLPAAARLPLRHRRASGSTATFTEDSTLRALDRATSRPRPRTRRIVGRDRASTRSTTSRRRRPNEVAFLLAKLTLEKYFRRRRRRTTSPGSSRSCSASPSAGWPSASRCKDNTFPQLLLLDRVRPRRRRPHLPGHRRRRRTATAALKPILRPYDTGRLHPVRGLRHHPAGLRHRATTSATSPTSSPTPTPGSRRWPQALEDMAEVVRYVKNHNLGLHHPLHARTARSGTYIPDFIACIDDGHGADDLLNLIVEVTGEKKKDKAAKVATARDALGAGGQQPRRLRALGVRRDRRPVGRRRTRSAAFLQAGATT